MAWFRRRGKGATNRGASRADTDYLEQFVQTRRGVEAFIEPRTTVTETTILLVATDGEWTRRRIDSPDGARRFAHRLGIPVYDVNLVGYPKRKRDFDERRKRLGGAGEVD